MVPGKPKFATMIKNRKKKGETGLILVYDKIKKLSNGKRHIDQRNDE